MTNVQILTLVEDLPLVDVPDMDGDFNYAISANLINAESVAISIRKAIEPSQEVKDFEEKLKAIRKEHSRRNEDGSIDMEEMIVGKQVLHKYNIDGLGDADSAYNKAVDKLKEAYSAHLEARKESLKFLEKENAEFVPIMIPKKLIPKGLPRNIMNTVFLLIEK